MTNRIIDIPTKHIKKPIEPRNCEGAVIALKKRWMRGINRLKNPNNTGYVLLVTARDTNGDGQNEIWDFMPSPATTPPLYEYTNVAWLYGHNWGTKIYPYFGWFYVPFEITFERLN